MPRQRHRFRTTKLIASMAGTTGLAATLTGSLLIAHAGATEAPTTVPASEMRLTSYSTHLSRHVRSQERRVKAELRTKRHRADVEKRHARAAEKRRKARIAAQPSGTPQEMAETLVEQRGWDSSQWGCLDELWTRESGWNVEATNPSSGAYGIPQALPGDKMAEAGSDWQTDALTQIRWGLDYIADTYGSPCAALEHSDESGYY